MAIKDHGYGGPDEEKEDAVATESGSLEEISNGVVLRFLVEFSNFYCCVLKVSKVKSLKFCGL